MSQYLIHTFPSRLWYVEGYLIPSMKAQGITDEQIIVYNDKNRDGELISFLKSLEATKDKDIWHIQDDVIISSKFKEVTETHNEGIVCGFCNSYSTGQSGTVLVWDMWYSMPCIRIPSSIAQHFLTWMRSPEVNKKYQNYFRDNKHDDIFLQFFLRENYATMRVENIAPNIVNHIDYLIGGSLINKDRPKTIPETMSSYWEEPQLLDDIANRLCINKG